MATKGINRGEIWWVNAQYNPEENLYEMRADRPAVIISSDKLNGTIPTYEVVYLTTRPKNDMVTHCTIRSSERLSTALCEQIDSVGFDRIGDYFGKCTEEEMRMIESCVQISLGLGEQEDHETADKLRWAETMCKVYKTMYEELLDKVIGQMGGVDVHTIAE